MTWPARNRPCGRCLAQRCGMWWRCAQPAVEHVRSRPVIQSRLIRALTMTGHGRHIWRARMLAERVVLLGPVSAVMVRAGALAHLCRPALSLLWYPPPAPPPLVFATGPEVTARVLAALRAL
jgi:hypothetical protein